MGFCVCAVSDLSLVEGVHLLTRRADAHGLMQTNDENQFAHREWAVPKSGRTEQKPICLTHVSKPFGTQR